MAPPVTAVPRSFLALAFLWVFLQHQVLRRQVGGRVARRLGGDRALGLLLLDDRGASALLLFFRLGVNVQVLQPGQPNCKYHSEPVQEDFLVLHGECLVILDGEEHPLRQWDLVHCPAGVEHVFVGAGDGPSAVLMIGSRRLDEAHYPVNAVAAKYDASVEVATDESAEAYAVWRAEARSSASRTSGSPYFCTPARSA